MSTTDAEVDLTRMIAAFEEVGHETLRLVRHLDEGQADLPTDCPGWSVRDQLAHMVGLEQELAGAPHPVVELPALDHLVSDLDRYMEAHVHVRRGLPLVSIADEFEAMLPRRAEQFRQLVEHGDPEVRAPMGNVRPLSRALPIRVFDLWTHEQDIRRAVGQPNRVSGTSGQVAAERVLRAWASTLPERCGDIPGVLTVEVAGQPVDGVRISLGADGPEATVTADVGVLGQLGCGRGDPAVVLHGAEVAGDARFVERLLPHLAFTP